MAIQPPDNEENNQADQPGAPKANIHASVERSLFCFAVGQMVVNIGWSKGRSDSDELRDRVPDAYHPQIEWLKKQGHASAHALLQAWNQKGLVVRNGRLAQSKILWMDAIYSVVFGVLMLVILLASAWLAHDTKVLVDKLMLMGLLVASAASLVAIAHFHVWPHIIGARAVRALKHWEQP